LYRNLEAAKAAEGVQDGHGAGKTAAAGDSDEDTKTQRLLAAAETDASGLTQDVLSSSLRAVLALPSSVS
jgi:hypothetical protein